MSQGLGPILLPPLAFQIWDAVGWTGQILFTLRFVHQWLSSERAKRSHVRPSFWWLSLGATALLIVYTLHRKDPVFIAGFLVNGFLYVRNLRLGTEERDAPRKRSPLPAVAAGLLVFGAITALSVVQKGSVVSYDVPLGWLLVGFTGQALWTSRFLVQWYVSERLGRSVLPPMFFWIGLIGAPFLLAYAIHRVDWVMMAAYALNPIPYARNLILLRRQKAAA